MTAERNIGRIKLYGIIIGVISLVLQHCIYLLGHRLSVVIGIKPYLPKIALDNLIPVIPIFILPYIWSYAYWAMAPMVVSKCESEHFWDYLASYFFACLFGALILAIAPTYMDREAEGLLNVNNRGILYDMMRFIYALDGGKIAYNLLPSFHCIDSTISYLGVAGRKEIPFWFRAYSLTITILIFASTVFVKQHFLLDVFSGIAIAITSFFICKKIGAGRIFNFPRKMFSYIFQPEKE